MTQVRPMWIVNSAHNKEKIDAVWRLYSGLTFYEVNRMPCEGEPCDREECLSAIPGALNFHQYVVWCRIFVYGLQPDVAFDERLKAEGLSVIEQLPDGFVADRIPGVRQFYEGYSLGSPEHVD